MVENDNNLLMTEDGHPIGSIVIADNTSTAETMPTAQEAEANRSELLKSEAQELTGNPDADGAIAELFEGYGDTDKRKRAMKLFIVEQRSIKETAEAVGVPARTVSMWAYTYHWDSLAKKELAVRQSQSILDLARFRADKRLEIAQEQAAQAKMIRDKAAERIENDEGSLKSNAEAWTAISKVEHTIVGMAESGSVTNIDGEGGAEKKDNGGKQPLVMVFQGGLPPVRKSGV